VKLSDLTKQEIEIVTELRKALYGEMFSVVFDRDDGNLCALDKGAVGIYRLGHQHEREKLAAQLGADFFYR